VSLRPNDPFAKRLLSTPVTTNNLLLKVTVPRRTGRKRKRGTTEPFLSDNQSGEAKQTYIEAADIYRTLQDNASRYEVAFAGVVDKTHRFRSEQQNTHLRFFASLLTSQLCPTCNMLRLRMMRWLGYETMSCPHAVSGTSSIYLTTTDTVQMPISNSTKSTQPLALTSPRVSVLLQNFCRCPLRSTTSKTALHVRRTILTMIQVPAKCSRQIHGSRRDQLAETLPV
jgi:hypothetical protein